MFPAICAGQDPATRYPPLDVGFGRNRRATRPRLFGSTVKGRSHAEQAKRKNAGSRNEGEGNKTAGREYNEAQRRFAETGKVDEKAREAEKSLDAEKRELKRAEAVGKSHAHGEDPALKRK